MFRKSTVVGAAAAFLTASLLFPAQTFGQDYRIKTIALTGELAPGTAGRTFAFLRIPTLNALGEAVFTAALDSSDFTNRQGIWVGNADSLSLVARQGDKAPGTIARTFERFGLVNSSASGEVAFVGVLDPSDRTNDSGIWVGAAGSLSLLAREGEVAPGTGGEIFASLKTPVMDPSGEVAFDATLPTALSGDRGFWVTNAGSLSLLAREGDLAPGTIARTFRELKFLFRQQPVLNPSGELAFVAQLDHSDFTNDRGIWAGSLGSLEIIGREGDVAPGTWGTRTFFLFDPPAINAAGDVAFEAVLDLSDSSNHLGIWVGNAGGLALVARRGFEAPGTGGRTFDLFFKGPVLSASGEVAFAATLDPSDSSNNSGIWMGGVGALTMIARKGDVAPGTPGLTYNALGVPALNASGELAFEAILGSTFGPRGIFAGRPSDLALIVVTGDQLEVAPGDFRTVTYLGTVANSGNEDGRLSSFNDAAQVAFRAIFSDGSEGIFIASPPGPVDLFTDLIDAVIAQDFNPGVENPLLDKLNTALNVLDKNPDNVNPVINILGDFIDIIEAKRGKMISDAQADELIALAEEIILLLEAA